MFKRIRAIWNIIKIVQELKEDKEKIARISYDLSELKGRLSLLSVISKKFEYILISGKNEALATWSDEARRKEIEGAIKSGYEYLAHLESAWADVWVKREKN